MEIGPHRLSVPAFEKRAVREAIVNAFCHRDYAHPDRTRVAINEYKLKISNPGTFAEGISVYRVLDAMPCGPNLLLSDVLLRIGLAERSGRGIDRIFEGSLKFGSAPPTYGGSTATHVVLEMPRNVPDETIAKLIVREVNRRGVAPDAKALLVVRFVKQNPGARLEEIQKTLGINAEETGRLVDNLVAKELLHKIGTRELAFEVRSIQDEEAIPQLTDSDKTADDYSMDERVLALIRSLGVISTADIVQRLGISRDRAYRILKHLSERVQIERIGTGKYTRYELKE